MRRPPVKVSIVLIVVGAALLAAAAAAEAAPTVPDTSVALAGIGPFDYSDVVLLGNNNSQTSRNLTLHFQQVHSVPTNNVIFADLPDAESISEAQWNSFAPWFTGEMTNRSLGSGINYIVTFKGMPIRVYWTTAGGPSSFQDALMLLGGTYESYIGNANLYPNPYFNSTERFSFSSFGIRLVTGIYAYNESTAMALIDRAANSLGSRGEFVLDVDASKGYSNSHGTYGYANSALVWANATLSAEAWPTYLDTNNTYVTGRTNVIGYSSWGSNDCCWGSVTQVALPHNTWVNGSIGETFVSTGGRTFTWPPSYGQSLIADWIDEGANGMKGYTDEPYINAIADGHILYGRYIAGSNMAESYWAASHFVGWRQIVIGDPKMAPFADIGDLDYNRSSCNVWPGSMVQFASFNATLCLKNTGVADKVADFRITVEGFALINITLSLPARSSSSFRVHLDFGPLPASLWGFLEFTMAIDPDGAVREQEERNNNVSAPIEVLRPPIATVDLQSTAVLTGDLVRLSMGVARADRSISYFDVRLDGVSIGPLVAVNNSFEFSTSFNHSGSHQFLVAAVDTRALRSQDIGPLALIVGNRAPSALISSNASSPLSLESVLFDSAGSSDPDGQVVSYAWTVVGLSNGTGPLFTVIFPRPGNYSVELRVADDDGGTAQAHLEVSIGNRAPVARIATNVTDTLTLVPIEFEGQGSSDADGSIVLYRFDFDDGVTGEGLSGSMHHAFAHAGAQGAWLTVTDDWGATARSRVTVDVGNRAPNTAWDAGTASEVSEGVSTLFKAQANDPDGQVVAYTLDFGDGRRVTRQFAGPTLSVNEGHVFSGEGHFQAVLTVTDDLGGASILRLSVNVTHPAPTVIGGQATVEGGVLTVTYSTTSPYGPLQLEVELNGTVWKTVDADPIGTYTVPVGALAPGDYMFVVYVSDGTKRSEVANQTFHVADSSPPPPPPPPPPVPDGDNFGSQPALQVVVAIAAGLAVAGGSMVMKRRRKPPA
jgi:uncharacterized protein (TIGR03790 family)